MTIHRVTIPLLFSLLLAFGSLSNAQEPGRVTIIYDAFGVPSELERDWGFSALIEYGGRRILFDAGNDAKIFERNVERLGLDLTRLDAAVISHRHGDHTSGLSYLLEVNPTVKIYTPQEGAFFERAARFLAWMREEPQPSLPSEMRYFGGDPPDERPSGGRSYIWDADFETVTETTEIFSGFFLITTRSEKAGTRDMNEVSLVVRTPQGLVVIVGCSHPGVETILKKAAKIDSRLFTAIGGFHLVQTSRYDIEATANELHDALKLERVAPAHCTSELGFKVFIDRFAHRYDRAGVGAVIALP
jgi:7,8-dihydropterin-6-yl-methyl-4-(beta-D-ribofuranosyl)aminobenzene 5'-phosphate synthase